MSRRPFVSLIFQGERFSRAAMPLEALPELAAYRELVVAVARALYLSRHPDRVRLPKGFESNLRLVLDKVEAGSAVPEILRESSGLFADADDLFDEARALVQAGIAAENDETPGPAIFTPDVLAHFAAFGRTLQAGEAVVVAPPGSRQGPRYDKQTRRRLLLRAQAQYQEEVTLIGSIRAADWDADGFSLRTADGRRIEVRTEPLFLRMAITQSLPKAGLVRVRGTGVYDADATLLRVVGATDVSPAEEGDEPSLRTGCSIPIAEQVMALEALGPGWFDGEGTAFAPAELAWLAGMLDGVQRACELPTPYVYPNPEGFAEAEWPAASWNILGRFDLAARSAELVAGRLDAETIHEDRFDLTQGGAESRLGLFLRQHVGDA